MVKKKKDSHMNCYCKQNSYSKKAEKEIEKTNKEVEILERDILKIQNRIRLLL